MEYSKKIIDGIKEAERKETGKEFSDAEAERIAFELRELAEINFEMALNDWSNNRKRFYEITE